MNAVGVPWMLRSTPRLRREFATVNTEQPWGIHAVDGSTRFEVFAEQLEQV
jgi:hypothetical protein